MELLLDTHVWIWAYENPSRLGKATRDMLLSQENHRWVSSVSTMEISRLVSLGQYRITCPLTTWLARSTADLMLSLVDVDHAIAREAYALQGDFHADPADRLLVATARCQGLLLLTADERILNYPHVKSFDART